MVHPLKWKIVLALSEALILSKQNEPPRGKTNNVVSEQV